MASPRLTVYTLPDPSELDAVVATLALFVATSSF